MEQATPAPSLERLLVAGLIALVTLMAAIGVSGLGSANAAQTAGGQAPT